jgi:hypothetical protein
MENNVGAMDSLAGMLLVHWCIVFLLKPWSGGGGGGGGGGDGDDDDCALCNGESC